MTRTVEAGYWSTIRDQHHALCDAYPHRTMGVMGRDWGDFIDPEGQAVDIDDPGADVHGLVSTKWMGIRLGPMLLGQLIVREMGGEGVGLNFADTQYTYNVAPVGDSGLLYARTGIWDPGGPLISEESLKDFIGSAMRAHEEIKTMGLAPSEEQYRNFAVEMARGAAKVA